MAINPKLEFFRFKLKHKNKPFKTFRDFAIEELKCDSNLSEKDSFSCNFKHFMESFDKDISKDDKLKKSLKIETNANINDFLDKIPKPNSSKFIIDGVINGGVYGKKRFLGDVDIKDEESTPLAETKSVYTYYYIYIYLPQDHNEGMFIIHSTSTEDNVTNIFRKFISNVFRGEHYNKAEISNYCPVYFQDEFKEGALLTSMSFKTTIDSASYFVDDDAPVDEQYDVDVIVKPKKNNVPVSNVRMLREKLSQLILTGSFNEKPLSEFNRTSISTRNRETNSTKVFEWNTIGNDFVPVVYLDGRVKLYGNGLPDFDELKNFCTKTFDSSILSELRPDLDVTKIE